MMFRRPYVRFALVVVIGGALSQQAARGEEPAVPFVEGLRQRGYFDTAEDYLDRLDADPKTPADLRKVIPYQRALTLIDSANQQRVAETKHQHLERAAAQLEQFIKNNAGHPLLGSAKTHRGNIFLGKAQAYSLQANSPANAARRAEFQQLAKKSIDTARSIFQSAHDEHEKRWKSFPPYIPPEQKKLLTRRRAAELDYMIAQRDLALTTYEESQIYDRKNPKYAELLTKASKEFEAIHTKYRSQIVGLLSRMWQGKCFEEQGEIGRAEGIYKELMAHPGKSPSLQNLQRQVFHFHLICLNHEKRGLYKITENEASTWLTQYPRYARTLTGLGIRYQLAVAREKLAAVRGIKASEKDRLLLAAQNDAQYINRFPSKYKDVTTMMVSRLRRARGLSTADPKTFPDAFSAAQVSLKNFTDVQNELKLSLAQKKPAKEIQELTVKLKTELEETARLYRLAMSLATGKDSPEHLNRARYLLAYVYYLDGQIFKQNDRIYDTAVLSEFVARQLREKDPQTASNAAYQAMAAYLRAYNEAPQGARQTEMAWIIRSARFITTNWPTSERAADATFKLGVIYEKKRQHLDAARWFVKVPPTSQDQYPEALISAGLNFWAHYSIAATTSQDRKSMREALLAAVGEDPATAVADLKNPSWQEARRIERLIDLEKPIATFDAEKTPPAGKAAPAGKKPPTAKPPTAKPPTAKPPAATDRQKELQDLRGRSIAELQQSLAKLMNKPVVTFQGATESEMRTRLLAHLMKSPAQTLRTEWETRTAELSDEAVRALFQSRIEIWRTAGAWYLKTGIARMQTQLTDKSATPEAFIRAKSFLAEYLLGDGNYKAALALLTQSPHDVVTAIRVDDNAKRPDDASLTGRIFAGFVYQLLARGYIGVRETAKFRETMEAMEKIASGDDAENLTAIYKRIGRDTQSQIEQLKNRNQPERLKEELNNFRSIIGGLLSRSDKLDYNTLFWAAETAYGLGEGLGTDASANEYFKDAAKAYQLILDSSTIKIDANQRISVQLRQINCKRRQNEFEEAVALAKTVVKSKPIMLPAHFEAALALQDWAEAGKPDKYLEAINGSKDPKLWGWYGIAEQLRKTLSQQSANGLSPQKIQEYDQKYLQARYYLGMCRLKFGEAQSAQPSNPKRQQALNNAMREMFDFIAHVGLIEDRQFMDVKTRKLVDAKPRFEELSRNIQLAMGKDASQFIALKWAKPEPVRPVEVKTNIPSKTDSARHAEIPKIDNKETEKTEEAGSSPLGMVFGILFLLLALGGGGWFLFKTMGKPRQRSMAYGSYSSGGFTPETFSLPTQTPAPQPAGAKKTRPAGKPAAGSPQKRPAGRPSSGSPQKRSERPPSKPG